MRKNNLIGKVISMKMNKTVVVYVSFYKKHKLYKKFILQKTKYYAHDSKNLCKEGDIVLIKQTKPFSKMKSWLVVNIY